MANAVCTILVGQLNLVDSLGRIEQAIWSICQAWTHGPLPLLSYWSDHLSEKLMALLYLLRFSIKMSQGAVTFYSALCTLLWQLSEGMTRNVYFQHKIKKERLMYTVRPSHAEWCGKWCGRRAAVGWGRATFWKVLIYVAYQRLSLVFVIIFPKISERGNLMYTGLSWDQ